MTHISEGLKTTEFWLAAVVTAVSGLLTALGDLEAETFVQIVSLVSAGYALSRGIAKNGRDRGIEILSKND